VASKKPGQDLFRGDDAKAVARPDPTSARGIVSHILYLDGVGRATPYTSTTESSESAKHFAGPNGKVWQTDPATARNQGAAHVSRADLLHLLKGYGKGKAKWKDAIEVAQARAYVLRWSEHLLDWKGQTAIAGAILKTFR
jgi:hypothetical protein